jgi:RimJ/RimL family protein N-acetyltransferase
LEQELGLPIAADLITAPVQRALGVKLDKMSQVAPEAHPWLTYWLVLIAVEPCAIGLIGFKGEPDRQGTAEIGYGIVPAYRARGFATEATRALIAWAFDDPACQSVVADSRKDNLASNRVLAKVGMHIFRGAEDTLSWRVNRANYQRPSAASSSSSARRVGNDG